MANLRVVLSSLRKEVGGYVEITRTAAGVDPQSGLWVDARMVEEAVASVQGQGNLASPADADSLAKALALYEGDFLAGFFLPEASGFETWAAVERERLHRLAMDGLQRLGRRHLAEADYAAAVASATRLVQLDPLAEVGHCQLMEALARNGQRAEAMAQYETYREILARELGVEPQEETRSLYQAIRLDALPVLEPPVEAEAAGERIPHSLPAQPTPFYGRQRELAQLDELLADPGVRLVTISGVGGAGKTRLAYATAERQLERQPSLFADGVCAASLSSLDQPEQLLSTMAAALDFPLQDPAQDGRTELAQLTDYLRERKVLLVLDNFEHLLGGVGVIGELLQGTVSLRLLVTSRERLNLREERVFPLGGFARDGGRDAVDAEDDPFVRLFLHSARRVRPDFELAAEDVERLAQLRELTGGLPLAVELAASWAEVLPLAELAAEIGRDIDFLRTDLRDVPRRQRSMRAVFEASWRRLDPALQVAFSRLSLFRGGFTRRAAQEVAGSSLRDLASLSAKSFVKYEAGPDRYQIHELLRQFGLERLQGQPEVEQETRRRHAAYYYRYLHEQEEAWYGERAEEVLGELQKEVGNVRLAWRWAAEQRDVSLLAEGLHSLCAYYDRRGYEDDARHLLGMAIDTLSSSPAETNDDGDIVRSRLLVRLLTWRGGRFATSVGEALHLLNRAEAMLKELQQQNVDVRREEAFFGLWRAELDLGATEPYLQRSLSLYREVGDAVGSARATQALADQEWFLGNYAEAADLLRQALAQHKVLGNRRGEASALMLLGLVEKHRERLDEARQAHRQSYALYRKLGDRYGMVLAGGTLANVHLWSGDFAEARTIALDSLQLADEIGARNQTAFLASVAARACLSLGQYDEAQHYADRSLTAARALGDPGVIGWALMRQGQLSLASASYEKALAQFAEAAELPAQRRMASMPLVYQAYALWRLGQLSQARRVLAQALHENRKRGLFLVIVHALPVVAQLVADQGDRQRALELHALACRYPTVANSRLFADMMGDEVEEWEATLPPDVVEAARERGRARELWETADELLEELVGMEL